MAGPIGEMCRLGMAELRAEVGWVAGRAESGALGRSGRMGPTVASSTGSQAGTCLENPGSAILFGGLGGCMSL